jgi:A/G-specific adenine glycosylase
MLQQTQVATVVPYFERFVRRFPDVPALADAPIDEVLHHWSGLGYYARARNLHRAAQQVVRDHAGRLPDTAAALAELPGIGRSTAAAIRALSADQRHAILDGNVKRVLARWFAVPGWPGDARVAARLWELSETLTPDARPADYTQAIMDLGATLCTRRAPQCARCPVADGCAARARGLTLALPEPRPRRQRPRRSVCMLVVACGDRVLLNRRPPDGIWGGLWSFPEFRDQGSAGDWLEARALGAAAIESRRPLRHGFTHFELDITPLIARVATEPRRMEAGHWLWYNPSDAPRLGLAAPVAALIRSCLSTLGPAAN